MSKDDRDPPIVLLGRRIACENSKLRVYFDHIAEGDRQVKDYAVVTTLNESLRPDVETGVAVPPFDERGQVGLLRVWRHPMGAWTWEAARGFIEPSESAEAAALRELGEETGLRCAPDHLLPLGTLLPEPGVIRARTALYAAAQCEPGARSDDDLGLGGLHWLVLEDALAMADASAIEDASTVALLYRFARRNLSK